MSAPASDHRASAGRRFAPGEAISPRELAAVSGEMIAIPDPDRMVHLQLRRFAGCPICNLHLRSFTERHEEIERARVRAVVVFHSTEQELTRYAPELPFPLLADPERRLYAEFGVHRGPGALLSPGAWGAMLRGPVDALRAAEPTPLRPTGGRFGLPADFLIASDGRLLACRYGAHAYDQWSVEELLAQARGAR